MRNRRGSKPGRSWISPGRLAIILISTLVTTLVATGVSSATPQPRAQQVEFAIQAKQAGLNIAEARILQTRVDKVIAETGGKQITANEVLWKDGSGTTTVVLPGEKRARSLRTNAQPAGEWWGCPDFHLCTWPYANSVGNRSLYYFCQLYQWVEPVGSWVNNQTPGTRARFYDYYYNLIYETPGAPVTHPNFPGWDVFHIRPC